jgi:serine/threonine-protein phosphatase 4 regulatory subunit 1
MIMVFEEFQKDHRKWRIRESIAKQLPHLLEMYSIEIIFTYMVPILLRLCCDPVAIVREVASCSISNFISSLNQIKTMKLGLIESIKGFANSTSFTQRIQ